MTGDACHSHAAPTPDERRRPDGASRTTAAGRRQSDDARWPRLVRRRPDGGHSHRVLDTAPVDVEDALTRAGSPSPRRSSSSPPPAGTSKPEPQVNAVAIASPAAGTTGTPAPPLPLPHQPPCTTSTAVPAEENR